MPTYRRPDLLARCLDALLAQDLAPCAYEILVADDAASAATARQVARYAAGRAAGGPRLSYIPVRGAHGPAAARNAGWRAARGAIVAFTDDDCIPAPGWLGQGAAALAGGAVGATGRIVMPLPAAPTDYERNAAALAAAAFVTANCFYRRAALAAAGGFDERFTAAWREDSDLYFRILGHAKNGGAARLVAAPGAVVVHPVRPAPWGISLSQQRKSQFNALLYKKHPALYRRRIQAAPPWPYYGIVAAAGLALGATAGGARRPALLAAACWLGLTARFCLRRLRDTSHAPRHVAEMIVTSCLIPPLAVFWRLRGAVRYRVFFL